MALEVVEVDGLHDVVSRSALCDLGCSAPEVAGIGEHELGCTVELGLHGDIECPELVIEEEERGRSVLFIDS